MQVKTDKIFRPTFDRAMGTDCLAFCSDVTPALRRAVYVFAAWHSI